MNFIPVNEPLLNGNEKLNLIHCIDSGWISSEGPFVRQLEDTLASRVGRSYGIAVSNGSMALEAAIVALGIGPGDEVILPTFTIISCASAIVRAGGIPVLVDSDPITWNMNVNEIESKITSSTRAILVVHIYGLPVDMDPVLYIAAKYKLLIIEDAAEVIGQTYRGRACGSFGDISIFSFYPNKHITTGEGGMIVTNDLALAERCASLRNLCFQPQQRFLHHELGWNFRMSNLQAAVGVAQLQRLDEFVEIKRSIGRLYSELLSGVPGIQLPLSKTSYADNIYWIYGIVLSEEVTTSASTIMDKLAEAQIGTRPFFWSMHEQPVFLNMGLFKGVLCPSAENLSRRGFYLPSGLALTESQIIYIAKSLKLIMHNHLD